jgi:hypothetical protein
MKVNNMTMSVFDMPLPNDNGRHNLSTEELSKWMQKAYALGVLWGEQITRERYENKLTATIYYNPKDKKKEHKKHEKKHSKMASKD